MAKDWEYAQAVKWIAEHGGPQKAYETVKNFYLKKGAASRNPLIALVGIIGLAAGIAGKSVFDSMLEKNTLQGQSDNSEPENIKKAEQELKAAMGEETIEKEMLDDPALKSEENNI